METTGRRGLSYSKWHRRLGALFATDIDWVEFNDKTPIAIIETTTSHVSEARKEVISKLGLPAYQVIHDEDLIVFQITQFAGGDYKKTTNWKGMIDFLYGLRGRDTPEWAYVRPKKMTGLEHIRPWISELTEEEKQTLIEELTEVKGDF